MDKFFATILALFDRLVLAVEAIAGRPATPAPADPAPLPQDPAPQPAPLPADPTPQPEPQPAPQPEDPAAELAELMTGLRAPGRISRIGDDWSKGELKVIPWGVGPHSKGNPALVEFRDDGSAILSARSIDGKWNTGAFQLNKPQRGAGDFEALVASIAGNAVCAVYAYCGRTGTELDFEYIRNMDPKRGKVGEKGWALGVHMPLTRGGGQRGFGGLFVPYSDGDFATPARLRFSLDETECRFFIGGELVGTITRDMMPAECTWTTTSGMELFCSVEWHGSWAGWTAEDYAKGASMAVYGIKAPA